MKLPIREDRNSVRYNVLGVACCIDWRYVASQTRHGQRDDNCDHFDPNASKPEYLIGTEDVAADIRRRAAEIDATFRGGAGVASHLLISATRSHFTRDGKFLGELDPNRVKKWTDAALAFLKGQYGDELVHVRHDMDETTPHVDAFVVHAVDRWTPKTKVHKREVSHRDLLGKPAKLKALHSDLAKAMKPLGLQRGQLDSEQMRIPPSEWRKKMAQEVDGLKRDRRFVQLREEDLKDARGNVSEKERGLTKDRMALDQALQDIADKEVALKRRDAAAREAEAALTRRENQLAPAEAERREKSKRLADREWELVERERKVASVTQSLEPRERAVSAEKREIEIQRETNRQYEIRFKEALATAKQRAIDVEAKAEEAERTKVAALAAKAAAEEDKAKSDRASERAEQVIKHGMSALLTIISAILMGDVGEFDEVEKRFGISRGLGRARYEEISLALQLMRPILPMVAAVVVPVRRLAAAVPLKRFIEQATAHVTSDKLKARDRDEQKL